MSRPQYVHSRREEPEIGPEWVAIGVITGAVGLKGGVRLKVFTDDLSAALDSGKITIFPHVNSTGEKHDGTLMHKIKTGYAVKLSHIDDRNDAESLKGLKLYISRDRLPKIKEEGSFYYEDMEGLIARDLTGEPFGIVESIYNFGAGDILEVRLDESEEAPASGTRMYAFREEFVPDVNIKEGYLVIDRKASGEVIGEGQDRQDD